VPNDEAALLHRIVNLWDLQNGRVEPVHLLLGLNPD
jgi:hypothetical protein